MSNINYKPLRTSPPTAGFSQNDYLVIFGEVFAKGYVNGLIEAAQRKGVKIILSTVGRRDENGLRKLTSDELASAALNNYPLINVPLEAGFDMHTSRAGVTPVDQLKGVKMTEWPNAKLDWAQIEESRKNGLADFNERVKAYVQELTQILPANANVVFAHTMAGGVPRAKIYMPAMNRVFKGRGERFTSSKEFIECDMGQFALQNFEFVTAETFDILINATEALRQRQQANGKKVSYLAYGYHGTDVFFNNEFRWQTYTCYFQGWAKMKLEFYAVQAMKNGVSACVFNCPEILTNSSSVFQGVEVSLYPLVAALKMKAGNNPTVRQVLAQCQSLLKPEYTLDDIVRRTDEYLSSKLTQEFNDYAHWPLHNRADQMEWMLSSSEALFAMHADEKNLMTLPLSEQIFRGTGYLMLDESWAVREPIWWLGHDVVAEKLGQLS